MHARELVELAAVAAHHGPALVTGKGRLLPEGLEQYWTASKCRLDRWGRAIKGFNQPSPSWPWSLTSPEQYSVDAVVEEILASEVLTRVWSALLAAYDQARNRQEAEYFGRGVYLGHLEARNRVLKLLIAGPGVNAEQAVRLNRLRQRCECWSNLLVARLEATSDVSEYAPNPQRARDLAADLGGIGSMSASSLRWQIGMATMRIAFLGPFETVPANPDSNRRIAASILSSLDGDLFDSTGLFPSLWVARLEHLCRDTQMMVEDLFQEPIVEPVQDTHPQRRRFG